MTHNTIGTLRDCCRKTVRTALTALTVGILSFPHTVRTAAAQYGGATDVVCSAGGAQLFSLAVGAVALYYTAKGGLKLISGFDDKKSRSSMQQKEGNEKMASGAKTMAAGVIGPGLIAASLDYLGVNLGCLSFDVGILAIVPV